MNKRLSLNLLYITAFIAGAAIMVLEMIGFRILAPFFGYSIYVWGNLIGLIMAALTCGYYSGGHLADRKPYPSSLYKIIFISSVILAVIIFCYKYIMEESLNRFGMIGGSFCASTIIFGPVMFLLSMVSPYVIKLLNTNGGDVGRTSGKVYAISTLGSLCGVFAGSFLLIPKIGSHGTLIFCLWVLTLWSVFGLVMNSKMFALAGFLLPLFLYSKPPVGKDVIYDTDSLYFNIKVLQKGSTRIFIRDDRARSSIYEPGKVLTNDYWDFYCLGPIIVPVKKILILGMGTGTTIRQYLAFFPHVSVDAVELDAKVVHIAQRYFDLRPDPRVSIHTTDVRPFLYFSRETYDLIEMDVFRRPLEIPFYLATEEFFRLAYGHLNPQGIMIMNVVANPETEFVRRLIRTIFTDFPSCYKLRFKEHIFLIATKEQTSLNGLKMKLAENKPAALEGICNIALEGLFECKYEKEIKSLTDDQAPVEILTYNAVRKNR